MSKFQPKRGGFLKVFVAAKKWELAREIKDRVQEIKELDRRLEEALSARK